MKRVDAAVHDAERGEELTAELEGEIEVVLASHRRERRASGTTVRAKSTEHMDRRNPNEQQAMSHHRRAPSATGAFGANSVQIECDLGCPDCQKRIPKTFKGES